MKALFFDLDHSLIRPLEGRTFPNATDDWELIPGVVERIRPFMEAGYMFIIISNQGGIEAGYHTFAEIEVKLVAVLVALGKELAMIPPDYRYAFRYCGSLQEHPDRKPNPGMILNAAEAYDIDLAASLFVGDLESDREAAARAAVGKYVHIDQFLDGTIKPSITLFQ
jgi:D-glycero-D-manno-heptose 1,7-bisphosphate phosphatase